MYDYLASYTQQKWKCMHFIIIESMLPVKLAIMFIATTGDIANGTAYFRYMKYTLLFFAVLGCKID